MEGRLMSVKRAVSVGVEAKALDLRPFVVLSLHQMQLRGVAIDRKSGKSEIRKNYNRQIKASELEFKLIMFFKRDLTNVSNILTVTTIIYV